MAARKDSQGRFTLTFQGVRGSVCAPGPETAGYGGNTSCLSIRLAESRWLILDCGTGLRRLRNEIPPAALESGADFDVFFSHYHWDHIQGLPFFAPLYNQRARFTFHGFPYDARGVRSLLGDAICPPWFPVPLDRTGSQKTYVDLHGEPVHLAGLTVRTARVHHPQGVTAFRLEHEGGAIVYATDTQWGEPSSDSALIELCSGAVALIYDAQHTEEEQIVRHSHGHGTWEEACLIARRAGVDRLILFHHDPDRSDEALDSILRQSRLMFPDTEAAREGATLDF